MTVFAEDDGTKIQDAANYFYFCRWLIRRETLFSESVFRMGDAFLKYSVFIRRCPYVDIRMLYMLCRLTNVKFNPVLVRVLFMWRTYWLTKMHYEYASYLLQVVSVRSYIFARLALMPCHILPHILITLKDNVTLTYWLCQQRKT